MELGVFNANNTPFFTRVLFLESTCQELLVPNTSSSCEQYLSNKETLTRTQGKINNHYYRTWKWRPAEGSRSGTNGIAMASAQLAPRADLQ